MGLAYKLHVLWKVIEGGPTDPFFRLVVLIEEVVVQPEDDILSKTELDLPTVDMRNACIFVLLPIHDKKFLTLLEQHHVRLRRVGHYEIFYEAAGYGENVEPQMRSLIIVWIIITVTNGSGYDILKPENLSRLIVSLLDIARACYFPCAFTPVRLDEGERPIDPPNNTMGAILAFLKYPESLLVVGILQDRRSSRWHGVWHVVATPLDHLFVQQLLRLAVC